MGNLNLGIDGGAVKKMATLGDMVCILDLPALGNLVSVGLMVAVLILAVCKALVLRLFT